MDSYHLAVELKRQRRYHEAVGWLEIAVATYPTSLLNDFIGVPHWRVYELQAQLFVLLSKFHTEQELDRISERN